MLAILLAHASAALLAPPAVRVWGRRGFYPIALAPLAGLVWVIANWNSDTEVRIAWAPEIHMNWDLRLDSLASIMSVLVLGVGALVLVYCAEYFDDDDRARLGIFAGYLVAFAGAMFGLVVSDNMLVLFTFWELTTVLSFLLVGHHAEQSTGRRAALQALLVTAAGGLAMLVGLVLLAQRCGSYLLSDVVARADPHDWSANVAVVLILIGALSKSAIVPLHFWLPGAMIAPTPVSAYLHAAAMVKAGIYLVARLAPGLSEAPVWHPIVLTLGILSMLLAGLRSLQVYDLKLVLAFGTVSQLGFLLVLVGTGTPEAALAGAALLVAHALFKGCLFMVVGIIDHSAGTRDLRRLSGIGRRAPVLCAVAAVAALSMAAIPPLFGFVGKESAFAAELDAGNLSAAVRIAVTIGIVLGSMFTVGYSARMVWGAFGTKRAAEGVPEPERSWHRPSALFVAPPAVLAVASLAAGLASPWMDRLLSPYARTLGPLETHLALWHGWGTPLTLTLIAIACGLVLFEIRDRIGESVNPRLGNADRVYDAVLRRMDQLSLRMTGATQRGSLPLNQGLILITVVALPLVLLFIGARSRISVRAWDSSLQLVIAVVMAAMALGATIMRNRLASVLLVGVTGYGCGVIFALHGAPDLALTQFLVETLTLVIFVLVLRKFSAEIEPSRTAALKVRRAVLSAAVGAAVVIVAAFATAARSTEPIWHRIPPAAYSFGGGKNAVNVLLVDIRAWDTLGEISVLVVAATGVASLMFRSRRFGTLPRVSDAPGYTPDPDRAYWLRASPLVAPRHRSMVMAMTTRMLFPTIMVLSAYFFFAGHNAPGGGFAGGLTAGLALVLRYLAGGRYELAEALPVDAGHVLGAGLVLSAGTATGSLLLGAPPLSSAIVEVTLPVLGHVKFVTAMLFDLGVYLIVVGLVLDVLRSLGARLDIEFLDGTTSSTKGGMR
ncbi:Na+/H+ antiporter subunit A [Nocardia africana]|uniref:Multiple resistance and pH homeostasis protein A n=1 Tax=Nocardia africana TaxID=134964 RepID=A0A378X479_9NOCA|nr:Na+/H+ antiporter subunit A [Nocardia africana]MCC3317651.1 Na+/H+ antiporter subunit A [Nocardia africana]SUA48410.1 Multiple resistance and pH homeostasis protein A [Nocardia africana]